MMNANIVHYNTGIVPVYLYAMTVIVYGGNVNATNIQLINIAVVCSDTYNRVTYKFSTHSNSGFTRLGSPNADTRFVFMGNSSGTITSYQTLSTSTPLFVMRPTMASPI